MRKPSKRKMYQKRRKKEKAEQRKKVSLPTANGSTATKSTTYRNKSSSYNCKQYQQNGYKKKIFNSNHVRNPPANPITSYSESLQLWWQTYCSAIEFHTTQQRSCQDEKNEMLLLEKYANEYETSSEEEEGNEDVVQETMDNAGSESEPMDEEYLKFLEITHKHREQLRLKREQENI